jgi:nicotinate-nucleotide pyrophosphorylase (carboxylating)
MAAEPHPLLVEPLVRTALLEDIAHGGDLTTDAIVPGDRRARARIVARRDGVVAGLPIAATAFSLVDARVRMDVRAADGERVGAGATLAELEGPARAILTAERTALNFLGHLCGIATATRALVDAVAGTNARIVCTRKTTPGLRVLEKYAVRCGGGGNHRFGLDDAVLVKDNHIAIAGSIRAAVEAVRARVGHMVKIEVEVETLDQLRELLALPVDAVLLDNMSPTQLKEAIAEVNGRLLTEASGGIDLSTVRAVAESGVDLISVGWLTHSAPALDVALEIA